MDRTKENQNLREIIKALVSFSLPLILSGILQQLYNWADAFIVGNTDGELSLSAIGATTTPINFFITTITGFTLGLSVLIANRFGKGETKKIPGVLSSFSVILGGAFALISACGFLLAHSFMSLLHTPPETIELAADYIRIVFIGLPFLAVYNTYTAALRGIGDSRIPFLSILLSSAVNVLLDIFFVVYLRAGVRGAAIATVLSQITMTVFIVLYGSKKHSWLTERQGRKIIDTDAIKDGVRFGLPPMLQSCISSLGGLILQDFMNKFGTQTVTAITTAYRIDTLVMLPIVNLGSGISTVVAHSHGAGNEKRTRKTLAAGVILSLAVSLLLTALVIPMGGKMISVFGAGDAAVEIGNAFFIRIASFYPVFGLTTAFRGYLEGKGDLLYSGIAGVTALAVRIIASYAIAPLCGNMAIAYAEMVSWALLLFLYLFRFAQNTGKLRRKTL